MEKGAGAEATYHLLQGLGSHQGTKQEAGEREHISLHSLRTWLGLSRGSKISQACPQIWQVELRLERSLSLPQEHRGISLWDLVSVSVACWRRCPAASRNKCACICV